MVMMTIVISEKIRPPRERLITKCPATSVITRTLAKLLKPSRTKRMLKRTNKEKLRFHIFYWELRISKLKVNLDNCFKAIERR